MKRETCYGTKRDSDSLFQGGYTNRNFDFVMDWVSGNYIDHSPAGARSSADAVKSRGYWPDWEIEQKLKKE